MKCKLSDINIVEYNNHPIDSALYDYAKTYMVPEDIIEYYKNRSKLDELYGIHTFYDMNSLIIIV